MSTDCLGAWEQNNETEAFESLWKNHLKVVTREDSSNRKDGCEHRKTQVMVCEIQEEL